MAIKLVKMVSNPVKNQEQKPQTTQSIVHVERFPLRDHQTKATTAN